MEVIVTIVSKLGYFTYLRGLNYNLYLHWGESTSSYIQYQQDFLVQGNKTTHLPTPNCPNLGR